MRYAFYAYLFVAVGGALGAMARYALYVVLQHEVEFPWGTLAANLLGCLAIGVIAQLVASSAWFNEAGLIPDQYRLLFAIGFCGSFTTFSTLILELNTMLQKSEIFLAFAYLMASMLGGFALFYLGIAATRALMSLSNA